jgi:3-oxo-5-alpha-steroid 4-dehydrogenase 1
MIDKNTFDIIVLSWIMLGLLVFIVMLFVTVPYGRHTSTKWGLTISNSIGWVLMEVPALLIFLYFIITGDADKNIVLWVIILLFTGHYINRSLIYPFRIKTKGKKMPLLIMFMAIFFNFMNGWVNGYYLGSLNEQYSIAWLTDPRFICGSVLFIVGMIINIWADEKLINLRKDNSDGYQIPYGGLFNKISCPNFFGEMMEWLGFAILCWSLPALSFFIWTICNLIPRSLDHHKWYRSQFTDYPSKRKAVIPFIL